MLVLGSAVEVVMLAVDGSRARSWWRYVVGAAVGGVIVASAVLSITTSTRDFDRAAAVSPLLADASCVGSDSAAMLLSLDVMTRNLDRGCAVVFDVDGSIYDVNGGHNPGRLTAKVRRQGSVEYQDALQDYFALSDALVIHRADADGMSPATLAELALRPVLWKHGNTSVLGAAPG
jgi:alpha-1,2-mannosyltransferase